jgi:hypothetical protein
VIGPWPRGRRLAGGAMLAALLVAGTLAIAQGRRTASASTPIAVSATPITAFDNRDSSRTRFGALEFRGGLALTSKFPAFGGISALTIEPGGSRFLALTDSATWLRGRILYRDGRPVGIADAEMAPMLGPDGKRLSASGWYDTESLTELGGMFYAGIERVEKIVRFDIRGHGLEARGEPIAVPDDFKTFTYNKSLECLTSPPKGSPLDGTLIAITEHSLDSQGNHRSFLIRGKQFERFSVKRSDEFDVSDCTIMPPDDLLLLERRLSLARGIAIRIRRVPLASIRPGANVGGTSLIEADLGYQIDNMEGIAVHRNESGETIITLMSDDNFSPIQRNLLLQFALVAE